METGTRHRRAHSHGGGMHRGGGRPTRSDGAAHARKERGRDKMLAAMAGKMAARHGRGMRRGRMFDGAELRLVLLKLISDEPRHGYELIKSIEELTGGGYAPSPGTIYPSLTMLNEIGLVASEEAGDGRRKFTITSEGSAQLDEQAATVEKLFARLSALGEQHKRTDGAPVRRAMANLKTALQGRLMRGDASEATVHDVAALIDEVAQKIERL